MTIPMERALDAISLAKRDAQDKGLGRQPKGSAARFVGGTGTVPCPICEDGVIRYSVAAYNGHMHGMCSTAKCIRWME